MGTVFHNMAGFYEYSPGKEYTEHTRQVFSLAERSLEPLVRKGIPTDITHLIAATTTPDSIAPSLGQMIMEKYSDSLRNCHSIDIVQGCAGGVSSLILGCQLAEHNRSSVLVVHSDAAGKATSRTSKFHGIFSNGSFACIIRYDNNGQGLLHSRSKQYPGLSEVVTIRLGHDAHASLTQDSARLKEDPRKLLGLNMNNFLALKLIRHAEKFYLDFVRESTKPDIMILHQVNPHILKYLGGVFRKHGLEFIDMGNTIGNCGVASVGNALNCIKDTIPGKKILLCSFGTGGVITAGLWQN
jgi:3-oxoacyl-[acyl-carrier-protein] synthase III